MEFNAAFQRTESYQQSSSYWRHPVRQTREWCNVKTRLQHLPLALFLILCAVPVEAQQVTGEAQTPGYRLELTPLPNTTTDSLGIKQFPLEVNIHLAKQFVRIGFGPLVLGERGFQSTQFLTPPLSTAQAAELVRVVPEYGPFKGEAVAEGIERFAGRVMGVQFGREGSPVLYVQLPYWTHQWEGPVPHTVGTRISDEETRQLVEELRKVFVGGLSAEEFSADTIDKRKIRIWWHH